MLLNKFCPRKPHKNQYTPHTHTHTTLTHTHTHTHSHTHTHTQHYYSHTTHTHTHTRTLAHAHTHTHTHSHTRTRTHTHTPLNKQSALARKVTFAMQGTLCRENAGNWRRAALIPSVDCGKIMWWMWNILAGN